MNPYKKARHVYYGLPLEKLRQDWTKLAGGICETEGDMLRFARILTDMQADAAKLHEFILEHGESDEEIRALVERLVDVCYAGWRFLSACNSKVDALRRTARAERARAGKNQDAKSAVIDDIISRHSRALWRKKPRCSTNAAAREILDDVNKDLAKHDIKPLGQDAIRKRPRAIKGNHRISS